jgi:hypothetical protein
MQTFQTNLLPPFSDCHPKRRHTYTRVHDVTLQETYLLKSLKSQPYYLVFLSCILFSLFDVLGSHAFPKCVEIRIDELRRMWRGQCKWKLTTALRAPQFYFVPLAACARRNLFPREATWFPSSFEFDHLTVSWHQPVRHVDRERMMT